MTYSVTWSVAALAQLARIAAANANPTTVDREAVWIDSILRRYPFAVGESRDESFRLWYADHIGVWYSVDDNAMTVRIISAGPARRR